MPADLTPNPAHDHHDAREGRPSEDVGRDPLAPSTGPSIAPSTAASPTRRVTAAMFELAA
ncbi:hypothetical protein ACFQ7A_25755 [Streptomyces sp. NPDC056528]|uniref:hypothetical protein n=1 Tax=Streptomyces sp. NPDC056528 TaxID=3345854 RepID=UPI0036833D08